MHIIHINMMHAYIYIYMCIYIYIYIYIREMISKIYSEFSELFVLSLALSVVPAISSDVNK